jgi:hypothetical protein
MEELLAHLSIQDVERKLTEEIDPCSCQAISQHLREARAKLAELKARRAQAESG